MKISQFFRQKRIAVGLRANSIFVLFARMFALAAFTSTIPAPAKEMSVFAEGTALEGECVREGNPVIISAGTLKEPLTGAVKIRATDREGNYIEVTY